MVQAEGMGLAPWGVLGGGIFKSEEEFKKQEGRHLGGPSETDKKVSKVLESIAKKKGTIMTSVALAYVMHKVPYVFPIVGGRKISHLQGNIDALKLALTEDEINEIDDAAPFDIGFPMSMLFEEFTGSKFRTGMDTSDVGMVKFAAHIDTGKGPHPIPPRK